MSYCAQRHTSLVHYKRRVLQRWLRDCPVYQWLSVSTFSQNFTPLIEMIFHFDGDDVSQKNMATSTFYAFGSLQHLSAPESFPTAQPLILDCHYGPLGGLESTWWRPTLLFLNSFSKKRFRVFHSFCQLQTITVCTKRSDLPVLFL